MSDSYSRIFSALSFISSDDRDVWIRVGMAIKSEIGEDGFDLWDMWSRSSNAYTESSAKAAWKSFHRGGGVTIASLFRLARDGGWREEGATPLTSGEQLKISEKRILDRAQRETEIRMEEAKKIRTQHFAKINSAILIANAEVLDHPYLRSKQLPEITGLVQGDVLIIPLRTLDGELTGSQLIWWHDGETSATDIFVAGKEALSFKELDQEPEGFIKKFIPGTKAKGSVFRIGNKSAPMTIICEGYATGLSIHKAAHLMRLDVSVLVCFSAFNTYYVSTLVQGKCGIFADNDDSGKGEEYAKKSGKKYIKSRRGGFDANDELVELGIFYLAENVRQLTNSMK